MTRSELRDFPSAALRTDWTRAQIAALFGTVRRRDDADTTMFELPGLNAMVGEKPICACAKLEAAE